MRQTVIDLFTSKKFLAALAAVVVYLAGRFGFDVDTATLDRIFAALLVYVGAQGAADIGKGAAQVRAANENERAPVSASSSAITGKLTVAGPLLFVLAISACVSQPRARGAAAAGAFLDCQAPNVTAVEPDLLPLVKAAIKRWISGDGHIDASGLAADAKPIRSDLVKCTWDAAIAALATPAPKPAPGAPLSAAATVNGAELEATWATMRAELRWAPPATAAP